MAVSGNRTIIYTCLRKQVHMLCLFVEIGRCKMGVCGNWSTAR
ncbi:hypothetical protein HMPREF3232_00244 [Fannyhessea vaginae]|nr:hypothetical protein HMPREF3232_00244 [Fannyhessea vaginae]